MSDVVRYEVERGIATVTLDSPKNRNALSVAVRTGLAGAFERAAGDPEVRGVVLTGAGPAFCAGADLKEVAAGVVGGPSIPEVLQAIRTLRAPVVVKLNGVVRAGGLGLVAAADIAVGPDDATFAFTEVRIGVAPAMIAVVCREKMAPRALDRYLVTGETFSAAEAVAAGLLTAAVPAGEVDALVEGMADGLRKAEPKAVGHTKALLDDLTRLPRAEAFEVAERLSAELFASEEADEGRRSFFEKRPPRWAL